VWDESEGPLSGWSVHITGSSSSQSTVTDSNGYYSFEVTEGVWTLSETLQTDWFLTHPNATTYVVTVPEPEPEPEITLMFPFNFLFTVAHAEVIDINGNFNFGNDFTGGGGGSSGGGGGSSSSPRCNAFTLEDDTLSWETSRGYDLDITKDGDEIFSTSNDDIVDEGTYKITPKAGATYVLTVNRGSKKDTCTIKLPKPEILGEQVAIVPTGAPNAGAGGAAPFQIPSALYMLLGLLFIGTLFRSRLLLH